MSLNKGEISKEVSREEERKNDPTYQLLTQVADNDADVTHAKADNLKNPKERLLKFRHEVELHLNSAAFPIQRNKLIEIMKNKTNHIPLLTFLENIPNKEYFSKEEILQIVE